MQTTAVSSQNRELARPADEAHAISGFPDFDWLRFVLASVVALVHASVIGWGPAGNVAVKVFFSLSGFLIGRILLSTKSSDLPEFFYKRATRIWIPYFAAVIVLYGLSMLRDPLTLRWLEFLLYDVTFTHNLFSTYPNLQTALAEMPLKGTGNHFWSIATEEQFYLAAPLLIVLCGFRNHWAWIGIAALFMVCGQADFASISLGVLLATLPNLTNRQRIYAGVVALALLPLLNVTALFDLASPVFSASVVAALSRTGPRGHFVQYLGAISFPMYLNHWIGAFVMHGLNRKLMLVGPLGEGLLAYAIGIAAGAVAYHLIDRQVLSRRDKYFTPSAGIAACATAYLLLFTGISVGLFRWVF